ncbi:MAG: oligopeptide transporter, OPT family [Clostridiaceae bacterium]|nr:oligopeptide transporter, OPT family [Clostridiaceae bacterium]
MDDKKDFKPYIPADQVVPELTVTSILIGILLAILFGAANAYLGLRVGMTVSASIPAAVISMGIIRILLKRESILENNMVQTIGSAGESVAAGAIFTLPALFMWAEEGIGDTPNLVEIAMIALCGAILGVLFMIPLRNALIVEEHGVLPYPEGQACAKVLIAGEEGGSKAGTVFAGLGIAGGYKFIADGLKAFPSQINFSLNIYKGAAIGLDVLPALGGVGYICGARISSYLFAGGTLAWFVIMPLIYLFGQDVLLYPAAETVGEIFASSGPSGLWSNYVKYIGAGAVAAGGIISLIKSLPLIAKTFTKALGGIHIRSNGTSRTSRELPMHFVLTGILVIAIVIWILPAIPVNLPGALIIVLFGFFFAAVSSRMVGIVGSSNNPVSGMAIATLLITSLLLKSLGNSGTGGMVCAITVGTIICIIAAIAGDTSQDLKTGYLIGSTPLRQQLGELLGCVISALAIGGILYLLHVAWGYGSAELPAPQATLMKVVVEGVMGGNLPWTLVIIGVFIAIVVEILGIPVLPFAIGLYLPIHLSTPMLLGGLVRLYLEKRKKVSKEAGKADVDNGILYSAGLIAGEGLVGILLAVFAVIPYGSDSFGTFLGSLLPAGLSDNTVLSSNLTGLFCFVLLLLSLLKFTAWRKAD